MNRNGPVHFIKVLVVLIFFAVGAGAGCYANGNVSPPTTSVVCTQEAKQCPDGSYVVRTGPNCEFQACPQSAKGTLEGNASVGPICPVERPGIPCPVPKETYTSREIIVYSGDGKTIIASTHLDENGHYRFALPPGNYVVDIGRRGFGNMSKDTPHQVTIRAEETTKFNLTIDTGVR